MLFTIKYELLNYCWLSVSPSATVVKHCQCVMFCGIVYCVIACIDQNWNKANDK